MSIFNRKDKAASSGAYSDANDYAEIPIELIAPNPDQPRKSFDEASIRELAASIAQVGLIQPLVVRRRGNRFELIAGERRLRAAKLLGMRRIPCMIEARAEKDSALMAIIENLQRKDLHFFEEAECYAALISKHGLTQEELAQSLGKSQSFIANKLRLLRLDPAARRAIRDKGLSERHARALLALDDPGLRVTAAERIARGQLSVKESERLIEKLISEEPQRKAAAHKPRIIRVFKDYRLFINTINSACGQLRESGMNVRVESSEFENGVDIMIRVTQK
ncbi:MAG: ParB/RepB/Spo0J family partition protein [Clostridia bacterium]|nr:ParB/RepB/Spo0J family partition protein [Clostridia bacterium]